MILYACNKSLSIRNYLNIYKRKGVRKKICTFLALIGPSPGHNSNSSQVAFDIATMLPKDPSKRFASVFEIRRIELKNFTAFSYN